MKPKSKKKKVGEITPPADACQIDINFRENENLVVRLTIENHPFCLTPHDDCLTGTS